MKLKDLFPLAENGDTEILGMTADSRKVETGFLFAALKGSVQDGSQFAAMAIQKGAAAILSDGSADAGGLAHVIADEPRRALALAAKRFHAAQP